MTRPEPIAILAVGTTPAGVILAGQRSLGAHIDKLEERIAALERGLADLRGRMAKLEGLRGAIAGRRTDAAE